ncbi:CRISPR-associated endonuclease Cas1 [Actinomyces ruminis]|uniref:CRISPR-associated endonuclease Cas1 n=1 Tax=Actinomyces ruminis TaxID=1937003 RepID=UPI0015D4A9BF|nr:CRISPR-associated endonuclease Cas1 [Actinomyces ruminis]
MFESIVSIESLRSAWKAVARDKPTTLRAQDTEMTGFTDEFLHALRDDLISGRYRPMCYAGRESGSSGAASLTEVGLRDRVVERAVVTAVAHRADAVQTSCSFANRPGLGVEDAVEQVVAMRDAGAVHVMLARIKVPAPGELVDAALTVLSESVNSPRTHAVIRELARAGALQAAADGTDSPSSPCLAHLLINLALTPIDREMCDAGFGYVRYAGDVVVCTEGESDQRDALALLNRSLTDQGLQLEQDAITMITFDEGFCYLGTDFTVRLPEDGSLRQSHDSVADQVVYVGRNGSRVHVSEGRLIVDSVDGIPQMSIPQRAVSRLVLTGHVSLSAGARSWALANGVEVIFLSWRGSYLGQLAGSSSSTSAQRLIAQAAHAQDEQLRLPLARAIVRAKIRNQIHVLGRTGRRARDDEVAFVCRRLRSTIRELDHALTTDELMGLEGVASNEYFACLSSLVPDDVSFPGRSRRPPRDLANAALSYGYAILQGEAVGALLAAGLEPALGVLHASTDKRPSLALDLMEEFRPLLVDRTVVALLRTRRLRPAHAAVHNDGVWLSREGKKILVNGYEETLQRHVKGALPGFAGTWRRHIHHEAQLLARAIMEPDYEWVASHGGSGHHRL